ncbi:MAG: glycosyltransferase [Methylomarinum sp.]|nr:glycosyltransferase [Methylomarinum sp.]
MHISIFSSEYPENACSRIRLHDILKSLQPKITYTWTGVDAKATYSNEEIRKLFEADIFIIQRSFPRPGTIELLDKILFESGKPIIYETDDLLTEIPPDHIYYTAFAPYRPLILSFMANCDAVITSTDALKSKYEPYNAHCFVLDNLLNDKLWYQPFPNNKFHHRNRPLTIGFCGSPTHKPDLKCVEEAIERIYEKYVDQVQFSFFGCITDRLKRLPNTLYQEKYLRNYAEFPPLLRSLEFDIGLAPLENTTFNSCKSNIKFLEYSACGIPGIYSNLSPYNNSVIDGKTGILTENTSDGWFNSISNLIESPVLSHQIAKAAYNDIWKRFSLSSNTNNWLATIERIIDTNQNSRSTSVAKEITLNRAMWQQTIDYEQKIADLSSNLNQTQNQLKWLENQPILRVLKLLKKLLHNMNTAIDHI